MNNSLAIPTSFQSLSPNDLHHSLSVDLAYTSLKQFIYLTWHLVEPTQPLIWNWHLEYICDVLEQVTQEGCCNQRHIFNLPPGSGKSLMWLFWTAWEWTKRADYRNLNFSYSDVNTIRDNRRLRDIVTSPLYTSSYWDNYLPHDQAGLPRQVSLHAPTHVPRSVQLTAEQYAKIRFDTTEKGYSIASSVGGQGTGEHPHRIKIDDAHKTLEAHSKVKLKEVMEWWGTTPSTRISNDPAIIVSGQRVDPNDLSALLLGKGEAGGWIHHLFPMRYESKRAYTCFCHRDRPGWNPNGDDPRMEGELLFPARYGENKVATMQADLAATGDDEAQLGQNPSSKVGRLVTRDMLPVIDVHIPQGCKTRTVRGWDDAATQDAGDSTSGTKITRIDNCYHDPVSETLKYKASYDNPDGETVVPLVLAVIHNINVKVEDADPIMRQVSREDGKEVAIREEMVGSDGKKVNKFHALMLAGYDFEGVPVPGTKSKVTRFKPFASLARQGCVVLQRGSWNPGYIDWVTGFPLALHDDDVDSTSCAANDLLLEVPEVLPSPVLRVKGGESVGGQGIDPFTRRERDRKSKGRVIRIRGGGGGGVGFGRR